MHKIHCAMYINFCFQMVNNAAVHVHQSSPKISCTWKTALDFTLYIALSVNSITHLWIIVIYIKFPYKGFCQYITTYLPRFCKITKCLELHIYVFATVFWFNDMHFAWVMQSPIHVITYFVFSPNHKYLVKSPFGCLQPVQMWRSTSMRRNWWDQTRTQSKWWQITHKEVIYWILNFRYKYDLCVTVV